MTRLHHVAISVNEFEKYVELFVNLGMKVQRITGEIPNRQLWFEEGIQVKEVLDEKHAGEIDHIALGAENASNLMQIAFENNCGTINGRERWFSLPNGISIELMEE